MWTPLLAIVNSPPASCSSGAGRRCPKLCPFQYSPLALSQIATPHQVSHSIHFQSHRDLTSTVQRDYSHTTAQAERGPPHQISDHHQEVQTKANLVYAYIHTYIQCKASKWQLNPTDHSYPSVNHPGQEVFLRRTTKRATKRSDTS